MFVNLKLGRKGFLTGSKTSLIQLHLLRICDRSREKLVYFCVFRGKKNGEETYVTQMDGVKYAGNITDC